MKEKPRLTKRKLLTVYKNQAEISRVLGYTNRAFVCRWPMDEPIPEIAEFRLRHKIDPKRNWNRVANGR